MTKLAITIERMAAIDAGDVTETEEGFVIQLPSQPMIEQLIERLDALPKEYIGIQTQYLGVGLTAMCVRWGTYLATLMDVSAPLHPDLPGPNKQQPNMYSFITDSEMKRMNIEVSYGLCRLVQVYRERGMSEFYDLLSKAYLHLPMPHRTVRMNRETGAWMIGSLHAGNQVVAGLTSSQNAERSEVAAGSTTRNLVRVPADEADRSLANILSLHAWRNTEIENIHAGAAPNHALLPHQRRFTLPAQRKVLREVAANFGAVFFWFDQLFDQHQKGNELPTWPDTATAFANIWYGVQASYWSLTDTSSVVNLCKIRDAKAEQV